MGEELSSFLLDFYFSISVVQLLLYIRTRFDLNLEQEWIQAHVAQTINL